MKVRECFAKAVLNYNLQIVLTNNLLDYKSNIRLLDLFKNLSGPA